MSDYSAALGRKTRDLMAIHDIGGIEGVVSFLSDEDPETVRVLAAHLIGYYKETRDDQHC